MTYNQKTHKELMLAVLAKIQDKPLVLKGGTSLMLCYGLDRFSEDLDFDIQGGFTGKGTVNLENTLNSIKGKSFEILNVGIKKSTATVTRYMVDYKDKETEREHHLKIETSYRTPNHNYKHINGIKTSDIKDIANFKVNSVLDTQYESRTTARDLYDTAFIAKNYPEALTDEQVIGLRNLDLDYLNSRYEAAFKEDLLLCDFNADEIVLNLNQAVEAIDRNDFKAEFEQVKAELAENDKVKVEVMRRMIDYQCAGDPKALQAGYEKLTAAMKNGEISKLPDVPQQVVQQSVDISLSNNSGKDKER